MIHLLAVASCRFRNFARTTLTVCNTKACCLPPGNYDLLHQHLQIINVITSAISRFVPCIDDALRAEENGANRLELITAVTEGGLTPGIGLIRQVVGAVQIPVHVMVRLHSRSFVYSKLDLETMIAEIQA